MRNARSSRSKQRKLCSVQGRWAMIVVTEASWRSGGEQAAGRDPIERTPRQWCAPSRNARPRVAGVTQPSIRSMGCAGCHLPRLPAVQTTPRVGPCLKSTTTLVPVPLCWDHASLSIPTTCSFERQRRKDPILDPESSPRLRHSQLNFTRTPSVPVARLAPTSDLRTSHANPLPIAHAPLPRTWAAPTTL